VLLYTRFLGLNQSLEIDELFTVFLYVDPGPSGALFGHYEPNDHVLYELLAWVATSVLGRAEAIYRLGSVVPALAGIALLVTWAWRRFGPWTATIAGLVLTFAPLSLAETTLARGYGLALLAMVGMIVSAAELVERGPRPWLLAGLAASIFTGVGTHPILGLGALGVVLALLTRPVLRGGVIRATIGAGIALVLLFAPLIPQMVSDFNNAYLNPPAREVAGGPPKVLRPPVPLDTPITGPVALMAPMGRMFVEGDINIRCVAQCDRGGELWLYGLIPVLFAIAGGYELHRRRQTGQLLVFALPLLALFTVVTVGRLFMLDRFALFLLVPMAMLIAVGLAGAGQFLWRMAPARPLVVLVGTALVLFGSYRMIQMSTRWAELPQENYKQAAEIALASRVRPIVTNSVRPWGLWYYLGRDGVRQIDEADLESVLCGKGSLVFIDHKYRTNSPDVSCLVRDGAARITVEQRARGSFEVWIRTPVPTH